MNALKVLKSHGVSLESMVELGFELYVGEETGKKLQQLKSKLKRLLEKNLADSNVAMLLAAASYLDELAQTEHTGIFHSMRDPPALVADELIGMSIAEYIAGKRGLFNYVRYDKAKPGILSKLPPFMDDAVGALVAASMTRLFEE
jgi:alpha-ribazole phosphatase CobZ